MLYKRLSKAFEAISYSSFKSNIKTLSKTWHNLSICLNKTLFGPKKINSHLKNWKLKKKEKKNNLPGGKTLNILTEITSPNIIRLNCNSWSAFLFSAKVERSPRVASILKKEKYRYYRILLFYGKIDDFRQVAKEIKLAGFPEPTNLNFWIMM